MDKKAQIAAALKSFASDKLVKLDGVAGLDLYIKRYTVKDVNKQMALSDELDEKYPDDETLPERKALLELFDADGNLFFDPHSDEHANFISEMPVHVRLHILESVNALNSTDALKKSLSTKDS